LSDRGYQIIERNWRRAGGEIDIIARDGPAWVFVEVKSRRLGGPETALDTMKPAKLERLAALARQYLAEQALETASWRIDWVGVAFDDHDQVRRLDVVAGVGADT
jgi:putative endonuclease